MFSQLFLFSLPILPPPSFASFYFAFFLYFLFRIFPLVIITNSPSCCSYHEIYISTLPSLTQRTNTETERLSLPPKKKKKVAQKETTQKETVKQEKVPKPTVQGAIKAIQDVGLEEQGPANDILDLDPTPKPKRTRGARPAPPATEYGDWWIPDQEKLGESWRMPAFSDNESIDVKSMAGARGGEVKEKMMEKAKGKGKQKASEASTKASDQTPADTKWVPPKSKR